MTTAYCGIDVGMKSHVICLLNEAQQAIKKYSINNDLEGFQTIEADIEINTKICLEPTGVHSINIFLYFHNKGYDIKFCRTESSHNFREAMFGKKKHDRFDALALAKYRIVNEDQVFDGSKLIEKLGTEEHGQHYKDLSSLLSEYQSLRMKIQVLKTRLKCLIDLRFPEAIQIFPGNRGSAAIRTVLRHSKKDILEGRVKVSRLKQIQDKLQRSIGQYELRQEDFRKYDEEHDVIESRIKNLENSINKKIHEMGYASLLDYPCLGTIGLAVLVREVRDIKRFYRFNHDGTLSKKRSLKAFKKFLGISVTSNQSGTKQGGHSLARRGNMTLRNIIFLMAMNYVHTNQRKFSEQHKELKAAHLRELYESIISRGTRKLIALTKIMSKIAIDLFFLLKRHADSQTTEFSHSLSSIS